MPSICRTNLRPPSSQHQKQKSEDKACAIAFLRPPKRRLVYFARLGTERMRQGSAASVSCAPVTPHSHRDAERHQRLGGLLFYRAQIHGQGLHRWPDGRRHRLHRVDAAGRYARKYFREDLPGQNLCQRPRAWRDAHLQCQLQRAWKASRNRMCLRVEGQDHDRRRPLVLGQNCGNFRRICIWHLFFLNS